MYNCVYSNGEVLSIPTGPCAPVYNGQELVDAFDLSETVNVVTDDPGYSLATLGGLFVGLIVLGAIFKRR